MWLALLLLAGFVSACSSAGAGPAIVAVAMSQPPTNLDPRIGQDAASERLAQLLFSSLVKKNGRFEIEPDLAVSWETPDARTYVFHLRKDAVFHDGRKLTARDVAFTFQSILENRLPPPNPKAGTYRFIESVDAPDAHTVVFKLKEPHAPFLWNLARGGIGVVPEGSPPGFARNPIGSGPFRFVHYVQDSEIVLARHDEYYDAKPKIARLKFKIIPEAIVRALELRKGSVDIALNMLTPDMVETLRRDPQLEVAASPGANYQYLAFNLKDPVFSDVRVRKAIAHAIDRKAIVDHLLRGQARLASGIIPPGHWCFEANVATYAYDPPRAHALLREAGVAKLSFTYRTSTDETGRQTASVFQQQLKEVGVDMQIRSNEFATFFADVQKGNFQAYSLQWVGGNNDPDIFNHVFHSNMIPPNGANRGRYANPAVDRLIELTQRTSDLAERKAACQAIQRIVAEDLPYVSLWHLDNVAVYNKRISGVELLPSGDYDFLTRITVKD